MTVQAADMTTRLGLVGLGIMGAPIARRLRARGYAVTAWNLEPERFAQVRASGVVWADSPKQVWAQSDIVFTCVLGDPALESVCFGQNGYAQAGKGAKLHVDLSTSSPAITLELAPRLKRECAADWIDAPMSGGPQAAEDGILTLMIGGDEAVCDYAMPVLDAMAANVTRMGEIGAGQKTKILNQAIVGVNYVLMAELLAICKKANVDPGLIAGCLKGGMADSTILQRIFPQMAAEDFDPPRSSIKQVYKDLKSVKAFVGDLGLDLPVIARSIAQYGAYADGHETEDGACVSRLYEKQLG